MMLVVIGVGCLMMCLKLFIVSVMFMVSMMSVNSWVMYLLMGVKVGGEK